MTFSRRTDSLTGPAKVIDGDTIVVAGQMVRLHGIDAPELDQPFWWRGQQLVGGIMALAALDVLTAGVKVRCKVVERDRHGRIVAKVFSPDGVDISRRLAELCPSEPMPSTIGIRLRPDVRVPESSNRKRREREEAEPSSARRINGIRATPCRIAVGRASVLPG